MIVYFFRHASAGKSLHDPKKDARRPLDEEGLLQARYMGRMLASLDVQIDHIVSSPLKRALQTASLAANELAYEAPIRLDEALLPESGFDQFRALIARLKKYDTIIVVGHNPSFTEFLSKTISGSSGAAQIEFKKGAVAKVEMQGRGGILEWLVVPKIARVLQTSLKASSRPKTSRK
ncbi:MAG TPA: phosphoglycerate mutase family protein [Candidatus Angelobacter sp.]